MSPRDEGPSKTRRKRDAQALQELGEALAALPAELLDELGLPERLRAALAELGTIKAHEAQRRQRQFIGRLMRDVDPAPLQAVIAVRERPSREAARLFRMTESWRDRLIAEGEPALAAFLAACPGAARDPLAEALAAARAGQRGAPKRLFRLLRQSLATEFSSGGTPDDAALLE